MWIKNIDVMTFTGGTWVTEARRDEGNTESCSIASLVV
jgi:hypothetical protein